jgi:hypothetical protein
MLNLDIEQARIAIESIGAVGVCISALELIIARAHLRQDGLLSWTVGRVRAGWLVRPPFGPVLDAVFSYPAVLGILCARFLAAAILLTGSMLVKDRVWLTATIALTSFLLLVRTPFGNDGADQMTLIVFAAVTLSYVDANPILLTICLWFIAGQACLSYATSGISKLVAAGWRDGTYLAGIFTTRTYGHSGLGALLARHATFARWNGRLVIGAECSFPIVLLLPPSLAAVLLAGGAAFHFGTAVFMGLDTFFWAFLATYPAILYCSGQAYAVLMGVLSL